MTEDRPKIAVIPPLALLAALVLSVTLDRLLPLLIMPPFPWPPAIVLGVPLLVAALVVNIAGARTFLKAGTPINPYKPSVKIVRSGIYGRTRNPMYLGMIGILLAVSLIFSLDWGVIATALLWALFHRGVVLREEAYLTEKFGADYEAYLAETRRWL